MKTVKNCLSLLSRRQCLALLGAPLLKCAGSRLREEWLQIAAGTDGAVGAAALHLSSGTLISMNGDVPFPLASVCKVPTAMNILALIDEGKLTPDDQIEVLPRDVWAGVSDLANRWPAQRQFHLAEMIKLMVAKSDNTAVETLFRLGGGGPAIARRLRGWGIEGIRVDRSERQCALDRKGVSPYPPPNEWTDKLLEDLMDAVPTNRRYRATLRYLSDPAIRVPQMEQLNCWRRHFAERCSLSDRRRV